MTQDRDLNIAIGSSRWSTSWPTSVMAWSEFCSRLQNPIRGSETLKEYLGLSKVDQDNRKDVGGFVGGVIEGLQRKVGNVRSRDLVTLDLDNIPAGKTQEIISNVKLLCCAAAIYSTRKHRDQAPRLRIIIPTDRTMTVEEYEPIARQLAKLIGINYCDPTTFELNRLMFWPSCSRDSKYVCEIIDEPFQSADSVLRMYGDWTDASQWPVAEGEKAATVRSMAKAQNPTEKEGVVGAFCRTYNIREAIEKFLPGVYTPTVHQDRFTFAGGSTAGGAIIYENDMWLYSHHATDPCSQQLVNAFDMVRLHLFGDKDDEAKPGTPGSRLPSYLAMIDLAVKDAAVSKLMAKERQQEAEDAFAGITVDADPEEPADWKDKLSTGKNGYLKTINNLVVILQNDPRLKDRIVTDEFSGCGLAVDSLPWDPSKDRRRWTDTDDAGVLWYMETFYGIPSKDKLIAALAIVGGQNKINAVRDYLLQLRWDGRERLDTLFVDYLGAEDNEYTRAVARKSLVAAVARAIIGGVKYDTMPILAGPQGIGKSTLLSTLGGKWFSDSLTTFEGKDAAEMLQGTWINEIGELAAMSKYESAQVKQFLSKRADIYRAAYGRRTEEHPRRCVFFGTSNDTEFLRDYTGNRRFWPVDVGVNDPTLDPWKDLPKNVDKIWAEAVVYWRLGEDLYLTGEVEKMAIEAQESHREASAWEGMIEDFLETEVPVDWDRMDISERRTFLNGNTVTDKPLRKIDKVCATEIWVECLGGDQRYLKKQDSEIINRVLRRLSGWERISSNARFGPYGRQKGYRRRVSTTVPNGG